MAGTAAAAAIGLVGLPMPAFAAPDDGSGSSPSATSPGPSDTPTLDSNSPTAGPTVPSKTPGEGPTSEPPDGSGQDTEPVADTGYVEIDSVTPKLTPHGTLTVKGRIVNGSDHALTHSRLRLEYQRTALSSRDELQRWASNPHADQLAAELSTENADASGKRSSKGNSTGDGGTAGGSVSAAKTAALSTSIAPGDSTGFTFSVKASDLGFTTLNPDSNWGARGIAVELTADDGTKDGLTTTAPSFVTWYPHPHLKPSRISTLIPISGPRRTDDDGLATAKDLDDAVTGDGKLLALLDGADNPAISWAVDPALIKSIKTRLNPKPVSPTGTPTSSPTPTESPEADSELADWYKKFLAAGQRRTVVALPWADPDLQALTKSKLAGLLGPAKNKSDLVTDAFPRAITSTAWPVFDTAHEKSLRALKKVGYTNVLLSSTQQRFDVGYTPTARGKLPADQSGLGTVTADATLSSLLASLGRDGPVQEPVADDSDGVTLSPVSKGQDIARIIAETATITHERPSDPRTVLMAAPRNFTPDGASLRQLFDRLDSIPWMTTTSLKKLMAEKPDTTETFTAEAAGGALSAATLNRLVESRREFDEFSAILAHPKVARDHLDRELVGLASAKWHGRDGWKAQVTDVVHRIASDIQSVAVVKGSPVLLVTGDKAKLAVQVQNNFDKAAHVVVRMNPETPQLQGGTSKPVTVPAHRGSRVEVPVKGLANADVQVEVSIESTGGHQVGASTTRTVRVRADWENIGTAIIGAIVAVIFIFGIVRTFRRGRITVTGDDLAAAETLVNSRLETGDMPVIRSELSGDRRGDRHDPDTVRARHGRDQRGKHE
nr:DUF6049 family protein [Spelaeicoccus albus]